MVNAAESFGYVVGAIALLSLAVAAIKTPWYLPSARMVVLEETLQNTEALYSTIIANGVTEAVSGVLDAQLSELRTNVFELKTRTFSAATLRQEYSQLFEGLSWSIWVATRRTRKLRAHILLSGRAGIGRSSSLTGLLPTISDARPTLTVSSLHNHPPLQATLPIV